jgi:choline dehydrogenase-like flavoprotein
VSGVSFTSKGSTYQVKARREVLLCAGAFQLPQHSNFLESDRRKPLTSLRSKVIVGNPNVGLSLQDQPFVPISWDTEEGIFTLDSLQVPGAVDGALARFHSSQSGFLTSFIQSSAYLSYEQTGDQISDTNPTNQLHYPASTRSLACTNSSNFKKQYSKILSTPRPC